MARVTTADVAAVTGISATSDVIDSAIKTAGVIVDGVVTSTTVTEAMKGQIELYLAAHFAVLSDQNGPLQESTLGEARERYHNIYKAGLQATRFGQQAIGFDISGELAKWADRMINPNRKSALFTVVKPVDEIVLNIDQLF